VKYRDKKRLTQIKKKQKEIKKPKKAYQPILHVPSGEQKFKKVEQKPLFLLCSDSPNMGTGFGDVSLDLLRELSDVYNCHQIGWQWSGQSITFEDWVLHPAGPDLYQHNYGTESIPNFLKNHPKTKAFMTLQDIQCFDYMKDKLPPGKRPPWIAYFPIDTHDVKQSWIDIADQAEFPTTYSKFAHKLLKEKFGLDTFFVYHGIDTDFWKPLTKDLGTRNDFKKHFTIKPLTGEATHLGDKFVVGYIGRMNPRKMLPRWLGIFSRFAKDKDDVLAFWHTDPADPMATFILREWLEVLGIEDKFAHSAGYTWWKPATPEMLLMITNAMNVHLYPTGGEGFGLTIAKSMACGIPNLVTDYSTGPEFLKDEKTGEMRGELLKIDKFWEMGGCQRPWVDFDDAVEKLNRLYYDENLRKDYGRKSIDFVRNELDLKTKIRPRFIKLINEAMDSA